MSVVAVSGIPSHWSIHALSKMLSTVSRANFADFKLLNYVYLGQKSTLKTGYVRVSEKLDPVHIVELVNNMPHRGELKAFIPDIVPDLPPIKKKSKKGKPRYLPESVPENVLPITHMQIMYELQSKYCGLFNLSKKTGHKLLRELTIVICHRLKQIASTNSEAAETCFMLSKCYRRKYPHFGDFQLILSTLHALQDANGAPRAQISEEQLKAIQHHPYVYDNIPYEKLLTGCQHYADTISKKIVVHVKALNTEVCDIDTKEDAARKKVRTELKKMCAFFPSMLQQITSRHFVPVKPPSHRIWVFGEPFLPPREVMLPFLRRHCAVHVRRSSWSYNHLKFNVLPAHYSSLFAMDGTVINGAKLVIRSRDTPKYKPPVSLLQELMGDHAVEFYNRLENLDEDDSEDEEVETIEDQVGEESL